MKNLKKTPTKQLERFSTIFTQIGLVLVLFVVYITLEFQSERKQTAFIPENEFQMVYVEPKQEIIYQKEEKKVLKIETNQPQQLIPEEIIKSDNKAIETIITMHNEKPTILNPNDIIEIAEPIKDSHPETVPFINIENAPVFKGCEGLSKEENKRCFDKKMKAFVLKNFNPEIANQVGLHAGIHRIHVQFVINEKGEIVNVMVRAPHRKLEIQTNKMIQKLPKFTPGKQRDKPVKVKYTLPITFKVE